MKLFEFTARWVERITDPEELEELRNQQIVNGDEDDEETSYTKYVYGPLVIDIERILSFNKVDDSITLITMDYDEAYPIQLPYETFRQLYQDSTGCRIATISYKPISIEEKDDEESSLEGSDEPFDDDDIIFP